MDTCKRGQACCCLTMTCQFNITSSNYYEGKAWWEIATEVEMSGKQSMFQFSPNRRHLDLDDSAPSLNAVNRHKKKKKLVCGKLMARQILTRFDPDKKSAVLRQKNRLVCGSLYASFFLISLDETIFAAAKINKAAGKRI